MGSWLFAKRSHYKRVIINFPPNASSPDANFSSWNTRCNTKQIMECLNNDQLTTTIPFNKSPQQKIVDETIFVYPYSTTLPFWGS